jgi:hypothetical protein
MSETYSIETDGHGGFDVWASSPDRAERHVVVNFPTWRQARDWVDGRSKTST